MSLKKSKEEETGQDWNRKVTSAYQFTLTSLAPIASYLLSIWLLACLLGWQRANSYYSSLGAKWLTSELTTLSLLSFSYWPVLAFVIGMLLTFSDVADRNFFEKRKNTALIICITLLFFGMCFAGWENWNERYANSAATYWSALFLLALIVGLNFGVLALRLFENNFKWHSNDIWVASIFIFLFLFFSGSLGTAEGIRDAHPEQSELDIVENINGDVLRLLLQKNGLIYAAELRVKENPKITILNHDEIRYISKIAKKTKGQKDDPSTQKK